MYFRGERVIGKEKVVEGLDVEWMALIVEARELGIDKESISEFLKQNRAGEMMTKS